MLAMSESHIEGASTGARANAGAAADLAEAPPELEAVDDTAPHSDAAEVIVTLSRAPDGSLGLTIVADDEGRPVVQSGRDGVLAGDVSKHTIRTTTPSTDSPPWRWPVARASLTIHSHDRIEPSADHNLHRRHRDVLALSSGARNADPCAARLCSRACEHRR